MACDEITALLEDDSWLRDSPPRVAEPVNKPAKRARAISIDEFLKNSYQERQSHLAKKLKSAKLVESDSSDDEDICPANTEKELQFETLVKTCENQVHAEGATVAVPRWGLKMFGLQSQHRGLATPKLGNIALRAFSAARALTPRLLIDAGPEDDEAKEVLVLELLTGQWLFPLAVSLNLCDEGTLRWLFHHMVYSINMDVELSACDFLCKFLLSRSESSQVSWVPPFGCIMVVLQDYGYLEISTEAESSSDRGSDKETLQVEGPPHNLGSLLRFLSVCCKTRYLHEVFSAQEAAALLVIISTLLLDRELLSFAILIYECLETMVDYFREDEWASACKQIAMTVSSSNMQMCNHLRLTRSLHGVMGRMKQLQKTVALHLLAKSTGCLVVPDGIPEVISMFGRIDLRNKAIDFVNLYYQLVLADIWLWSNPLLKSEQTALESWLLFLKACSFQISSTDWRPYASKVRNWASLLLQNYEGYRKLGDWEDY
eukprot:c26256_g1_i2 orf=299-1762(+)